ncbi:MAG TPA: GTPase ObgE [Anaerolineae bacterium]|nr:GTPase ObgE [Anaerolineae bacterium]
MFVDEIEIYVCSGKGGDGLLHFRKEKYINRGGPDGGDGGKGGDIVFRINPHLNTLAPFRHKERFVAQNGKRGGPQNQTGRSGEKLAIEVPPGTLIFNGKDNVLLGDMTEPDRELIVCLGGRGGRGSARFATSRNQAPRIAEKGEPGVNKGLRLELKLIADIGIIGMPNAGKSSLLAAVTNARPKIADYPFTTLVPNIGVAELNEEITLILADIPGLIEGAHTGLGLGDAFLRHIQRTKVLLHLLDGLSSDPIADYAQINTELSLFDPKLSEKPQVVAFTKIDLLEVQRRWPKVKSDLGELGLRPLAISALQRNNLKTLLLEAHKILINIPEVGEISDKPIYRPETDERAFKIVRLSNGWRIRGIAIERAAAMTYWEYFGSVRRFQRILEALGIHAALKKAGVSEGDTVKIGNHELSWIENLNG